MRPAHLKLSAFAAILALPAPVLAEVPAALLSCAGIARDADRLACYDKAVAAASPEARAASEVRARESARIAKEEAAAAAAAAAVAAKAQQEAKKEAFGAEAIATRPDRYQANPDQIQAIEAGITEMMTNVSGLGVFLLDNGQLWRQADTVSLPNIRIGDKVKIARAPLGGYNMTFLKQKRTTLVKRMR